jgi:hypothetical protein
MSLTDTEIELIARTGAAGDAAVDARAGNRRTSAARRLEIADQAAVRPDVRLSVARCMHSLPIR